MSKGFTPRHDWTFRDSFFCLKAAPLFSGRIVPRVTIAKASSILTQGELVSDTRLLVVEGYKFEHDGTDSDTTLTVPAPMRQPCVFHKWLFIERRIATYVLQYSSHCKTCPSQLCEICAHQKEVFCI